MLEAKLFGLELLGLFPQSDKRLFILVDHFHESFLFVGNDFVEHFLLLLNLAVEESDFGSVLIEGEIKMLDVFLGDFGDDSDKALVEIIDNVIDSG